MSEREPRWVWKLFRQLRARGFLLGPQDYGALRDALRAGFGWASDRALCDLCVALWAKSEREAEVVYALFEQLNLDQWELPGANDVLRVRPDGTAPPVTGGGPEKDGPIVEPPRSAPPRTGAYEDLPSLTLEGADTTVLDALPDPVVPLLDSVLPEVAPLVEGDVYRDAQLGEPEPLSEAVQGLGPGAAAVVIGDAGAARGRFDLVRLLDSVAFLKGLRAAIPHYAWLNPVPQEDWQSSTAAQLARHAPMFPLDRMGLDQAIQVLRGHPPELERPL